VLYTFLYYRTFAAIQQACRNQKTPDPALLFLNSCNTYHNAADR
jgi:hypothetical protein